MIPCKKNDGSSIDDGFLYGVSLVLNFNTDKHDLSNDDQVLIEFVEDETHKMTWSKEKEKSKLSIFTNTNIEEFNKRLNDTSVAASIERQKEIYSKSSSTTSPCYITVGIALLSDHNVIPSMRRTLSHFFNHTSSLGSSITSNNVAMPLAHILECFRSSQELDNFSSVLSTLLDPYLDFGCSSLEAATTKSLSLSDQKHLFEASAIESLVESIPPIPLALLFVTALLEQKIIFTSKRRSGLVSMTTALKKLLRPFEWSHLFVPLVPDGLASDLVQYPAPFILGIPFSSDTLSLLKRIPDDITIVDVDVGRVILAKNFSVDLEGQSNEDKISATMNLRSQVLHLAETLGGVIGCKECERLWSSDSPHIDSMFSATSPNKESSSKGEAVQKVISSFIRELLAGK